MFEPIAAPPFGGQQAFGAGGGEVLTDQLDALFHSVIADFESPRAGFEVLEADAGRRSNGQLLENVEGQVRGVQILITNPSLAGASVQTKLGHGVVLGHGECHAKYRSVT